MDPVSFDALSRRASLMTLGTAGLAALASPLTVDAKKKKKKKGDVNKLCKRQIGECNTFVTITCAGDPECLDALPCCQELKTCDFAGFLNCLIVAGS
jgi:hypothetical protein